MSKEIRLLLLLAAATLSVVAVPLIAALVVHLNSAVMAAIVSGAGALVAALGTSVFWGYSKAQSRRANQALIEYERDRLATIAKILDTLPPGAVYRERGDRPVEVMIIPPAPAERSKFPPNVQLLDELADIEGGARALLGEGSSTSIIRIRSRLRDSGVWSEEDVYDFDNALRVRNKVAHGDQEELTEASLTEAIEIMKRLRLKLEASQLAPPGN